MSGGGIEVETREAPPVARFLDRFVVGMVRFDGKDELFKAAFCLGGPALVLLLTGNCSGAMVFPVLLGCTHGTIFLWSREQPSSQKSN